MTTTQIYDMNAHAIHSASDFSARDTVRSATCDLCGGAGQVATATLNRREAQMKICPDCHGAGSRSWFSAPRTTVMESGGWVVVEMDLPGATSEDVDITVESQAIRVRTRSDRAVVGTRRGTFDRRLELPRPVDQGRQHAVRSRLRAGVLRVVVPVITPERIGRDARMPRN